MNTRSAKRALRGAQTRIVYLLSRAALSLGMAGTTTGSTGSLLLAAPGGGNLGDQAMLETFLDHTRDGARKVVVQSAESVDVKSAQEPVSTFVVLPDVTHGKGLRHFRSLYRLGGLLRNTQHLAVVGADVMDGAYSEHASAMRWLIATIGARRGVATRILGFSWNANPKASAKNYMRAASEAGVVMCARDPLSAQRLRADGSRTVMDVADTVFVFSRKASSSAPLSEVQSAHATGAPIAIINASGFVATSTSQKTAYASIVDYLHRSGHRIFMLPHVDRGPRGDVYAISQVVDALSDGTSVTILPLTDPATVKEIASMATLVVTGRMHLAILAMSVGTPTAVVATQGKVLGLLRMFDLEQLAIEPDESFAERMEAAVHDLVNDNTKIREAISTSLEAVTRKAGRNFDFAAAVPR